MTTIDGIDCYAPEMAHSDEYYPVQNFEVRNVTLNNWWTRSRNKLIRYLLSTYLLKGKKGQDVDFLEIGCGDGIVLHGLKDIPVQQYGSDLSLAALQQAKDVAPHIRLFQMDVFNVPFENKFASIGMFDVLEHLDDDEGAMANVYKALRPGGYFFITVPQHQFMFSAHDEYLHHRRRYSRQLMVERLRSKGFKILEATSFVSVLFPMMYVMRKLGKDEPVTRESLIKSLTPPAWMNKLLEALNWLDLIFIRLGIPLPFGGTLVVVAQK